MEKHTETQLDYDQILAGLREKRGQIDEAISAIGRLAIGETAGRGAPMSLDLHLPSVSRPQRGRPAKKKRVLSEAGRQRIIEATQRRWALVRAAKEADGEGEAVTAVKTRRRSKTTRKKA